MKRFLLDNFKISIGHIWAGASSKGLVFLLFTKPTKKQLTELSLNLPDLTPAELEKSRAILTQLKSQLKLYLDGDKYALEGLPIHTMGTAFQNKVWRNMRSIKPGTVLSYAQLAIKSGYPKAARAVGSACANNPICLVVPCHRVIANSGKLGGYSGGLSRKKKLLTVEGATVAS